jgi:DNA-binding transcriptional ArsR family regulator
MALASVGGERGKARANGEERGVSPDALRSQTKLKLVQVLSDAEVAKLLSDPMRRAILNLLREHYMAESDLADSLGLTDASVNYHLSLLRRAKLISVSKTEIEEHGILKKLYEPTAYLYLPDVQALPKSVARYYYPMNLERIRGILSTMPSGEFKMLRLAAPDVDWFGEELARILVKVARNHEAEEVSPGSGEQMVNRIYSESLALLRKTLETKKAAASPPGRSRRGKSRADS